MRHSKSQDSSSRRTLTAISLLAVISLLLAQIGPATSAVFASSRSAPIASGVSLAAQSQPAGPGIPSGGGGLTIVLGEGGEQAQSVVTNTVAVGAPLSAEETQALLDRLPPLAPEAGDVEEFNLPVASLPPPTPSVVIEESFPPTETAPTRVEVLTGPLEVLRYAPEGEIRLAPFLQVTFNQPMVPLMTLEQLSAADVPVKLTPDLPGVWKWQGTKTLTFEYSSDEIDRFPMATEFEAAVPAGTTSATGGVLAETVQWTFTTPPPTVINSWPSYGPQRRDALMFASFDQRIDPAAVLETILVTAGGEQFDLRLASATEVAADETVSRLAAGANEGRWLAFRAVNEFPPDATVNVNIGPNTPSAEGPLTTEAVQAFSFQTFAPLRVTEARCSWGGSRCPPGSPFEIIFNNPLDEEAFDPTLVTVDQEIAGMMVNAFGNVLQIQGATVGRSTYKVTVSGAIQDAFGQTLGADQTFTFRTSNADAYLTGSSQVLTTLDPTAQTPTFSVYSVNHPRLHVRIYAVTPDDWRGWLAYLRDYWQTEPPTPPGQLVLEDTITVEGQPDQLTETAIDLSPALGDSAAGHFIVVVDLPEPLFGNRDRSVVQSWVQVTQIGLDAFSDHSQLLVWATALADGAPLQDVTVELYGSNREGVTSDDGSLLLDLPSEVGYLLVGSQGEDSAILPRSQWDYYGSTGWVKQPTSDMLSWFIFDDRQMYRPTEEVHLKGWLRRIGAGQTGDVGLVGGGPSSVYYQVSESMGNTIAEGTVDVNDLGGFDFNFTIPENANLGYANIRLFANGVNNVYGVDSYYSFQIQEFRRPEFEVSAQPEGEGPYYLGDDATVSVSAQYYAGGSLPNAETTWTVSSQAGSYSPPNWPDFIFGEWTPWWVIYDSGFFRGGVYFSDSGGGESAVQSYTGKTDPTGKHYLSMNFVESAQPRPYTVQAEGRVMDVNRQAWAASTSLLVHPSELYVGLRSLRTFVEQGDPLEVEVIVTDVDGAAVAERDVAVRAARLEWQTKGGEWHEVEVDPQECTVVSGNEPALCSFTTEIGGEYRITAEVRDDRERLNRTLFTRWVSGGKVVPSRDVEQEEVQLIPDKESYAPGDVAEILVIAPFAPAEGQLTVARSGILYTERFHIDEGSVTLRVPIEEAHIPNLNIQVDVNGSAPRLDDKGEPLEGVPPRPAYARGNLNLPIPPVSRTLTLEIAPEATELAPGAKTAIDLVATNGAGEPVENAELAVVMVDEAVLALTGYRIPNPLTVFYGERGADLESVYGRSSLVLANPAELAKQMGGMAYGVGGGGGDAMVESAAAPAAMDLAAPMPTMVAETLALRDSAPGQAATPIAVRADFNPLAVFAPAVRTDAQGGARVELTLPDNLTRYRVTVVAATDKEFGQSEANITARLPLMVRPSAPRFLNFGDRFELPIVVQNQTEEPLDVQVALQVSNLALDGEQPGQAGQLVTVPANDRVEVRFATTTENAGTARFQAAVAAGDYADATRGDLPVYTPATTEAFAVYGVVDEGAVAQPIAQPQNVFPQFGGLEISTSSTALSALTDAVLYLSDYPFECSEQISSRVLGIASLRDVLTAFQAEGLPPPEQINAAMARDILRLEAMQNLDGGWPIWEKGKESVPFYSIHVAHALQRARLKDYRVSDATLSAARDHLRRIESYYPGWYSEITRDTLSAYALYVRELMGDTDTTKARELLNKKPLDDQSLEQIAWLWQVLSDDPASIAELEEIRRYVDNQAVETAGAANFTTSYSDEAWVLLHSNRRTDAIVLDALLNDDPQNELIPKVVTGLLAHRTNGAWSNTQENVFVLIALDRYFNTFENVTPDFVARMWLGDTYVAAHEFEGYSNESRQTNLPMSFLVEQPGVQDFIISKEGDGRLYYRLGLRYAPTDLRLDPLDMGFVVQREYEAVDDPADVRRDEEGVWHVKAGARVRVKLTMVAANRRYHVALVDPLPAGFEPINPALAVSESVPGGNPIAAPYGWWWWYGPWYQHQNLRDSRAEAFTSLLWDGVYTYNYVVRATTPGEFVAPPAKAEEMYMPEVFGRSGSDLVVVE